MPDNDDESQASSQSNQTEQSKAYLDSMFEEFERKFGDRLTVLERKFDALSLKPEKAEAVGVPNSKAGIIAKYNIHHDKFNRSVEKSSKLQDLKVTDLPGIGPVVAEQLRTEFKVQSISDILELYEKDGADNWRKYLKSHNSTFIQAIKLLKELYPHRDEK